MTIGSEQLQGTTIKKLIMTIIISLFLCNNVYAARI